MISRFGSVELSAICACLAHRIPFFVRIFDYLLNRNDFLFYETAIFEQLRNNAGFFDADTSNIEKFTDIYIKACGNIDILGSWDYHERYIAHFLKKDVCRIPLWHLEPYHFDNPAWSRVLAGKKVLVVHPFAETIKRQYEIRDKLFKNKDILPTFSLYTIKAVQSLAGNEIPFNIWFDALSDMEQKIAAVDFDVAIIGCGAYGMPLANFVKQLGKISIHLGGATQLLFGIRGKRWDSVDGYTKLFNEYWCRPSSEERPEFNMKVEDGCYW